MLSFLFQMQRITKEKCLEILERFEPSTEGKKKGTLGIDGTCYCVYLNTCRMNYTTLSCCLSLSSCLQLLKQIMMQVLFFLNTVCL